MNRFDLSSWNQQQNLGDVLASFNVGDSAPQTGFTGVRNIQGNPLGLTGVLGGLGNQLNQPGGGFLDSLSGFMDNHGQTLGLGLGLLQGLGGLVGSNKQYKLARNQLGFAKEMAQKNMDNSMQAYNTKLEDRQRARAAYEGRDDKSVEEYLEKHRLRK